MLTLEEAQERLLALAPSLPVEEVPVETAHGRYLANDLPARRTQPPADLSAMDGYAIAGDGPWTLVGESRAGRPFDDALKQGQCTRISTGAHMPAGADRVLIQENAEVSGGTVRCSQDMPHAGKHVRRRGFDFKEGDRLLQAGTLLGPAQIGLALSGGYSSVVVRRRPLVAILDSGDELCADPDQCGPGQIPASNGAMIGAMVSELHCETLRLGPVGDDMTALLAALDQAEGCDVLVTSGGASVGDHDLMRPALEAWGAELDFYKVAMKPGKPVMVARRGNQVIVGLPGNPVSSFVTCFLFVLPVLRAMLGARHALPMKVSTKTAQPFPAIGSRREFARGWWDGSAVSPVDSQDSSAMASLAASNCLIDRPASSPPSDRGGDVSIFLHRNAGIA